jgi:hypothetical protein
MKTNWEDEGEEGGSNGEKNGKMDEEEPKELTPSPPLQFCAASASGSIFLFNKGLLRKDGMIIVLTKAKRQSQSHMFVEGCLHLCIKLCSLRPKLLVVLGFLDR